ncbi:hypothetical protein [Fimbriimonas ginsengisoli]|nr:hypothetical protein [Fimbriimonas ginsengisoli]
MALPEFGKEYGETWIILQRLAREAGASEADADIVADRAMELTRRYLGSEIGEAHPDFVAYGRQVVLRLVSALTGSARKVFRDRLNTVLHGPSTVGEDELIAWRDDKNRRIIGLRRQQSDTPFTALDHSQLRDHLEGFFNGGGLYAENPDHLTTRTIVTRFVMYFGHPIQWEVLIDLIASRVVRVLPRMAEPLVREPSSPASAPSEHGRSDLSGYWEEIVSLPHRYKATILLKLSDLVILSAYLGYQERFGEAPPDMIHEALASLAQQSDADEPFAENQRLHEVLRDKEGEGKRVSRQMLVDALPEWDPPSDLPKEERELALLNLPVPDDAQIGRLLGVQPAYVPVLRLRGRRMLVIKLLRRFGQDARSGLRQASEELGL